MRPARSSVALAAVRTHVHTPPCGECSCSLCSGHMWVPLSCGCAPHTGGGGTTSFADAKGSIMSIGYCRVSGQGLFGVRMRRRSSAERLQSDETIRMRAERERESGRTRASPAEGPPVRTLSKECFPGNINISLDGFSRRELEVYTRALQCGTITPPYARMGTHGTREGSGGSLLLSSEN